MSKRTVLIVEHQDLWQKLLSRICTDLGITFSVAASVTEARHALAAASFDLIILDLVFPDDDTTLTEAPTGLSEIDVFIAFLQNVHHDLPVLILSACEWQDQICVKLTEKGLRTTYLHKAQATCDNIVENLNELMGLGEVLPQAHRKMPRVWQSLLALCIFFAAVETAVIMSVRSITETSFPYVIPIIGFLSWMTCVAGTLLVLWEARAIQSSDVGRILGLLIVRKSEEDDAQHDT